MNSHHKHQSGDSVVGPIILDPLRALSSSEILVPGSKSHSNREILMSLFAEGTSGLRGLLVSEDTRWGLDACTRLGGAVDGSRDAVRVTGIGRRRPVSQGSVYVGSAGTLARFLPGFLAAGDSGTWTLEASEQMSARPMTELIRSLRGAGARIDDAGRGAFPFEVWGDTLRGDDVALSGETSSQFISGLLLAAPLARRPMTIRVQDGIVQSDYVRLTIQRMLDRGVSIEAAQDLSEFRVRPSAYRALDVLIEADASTATYFSALPAILGGSITLKNLPARSYQPDLGFLDILQRMGCVVDRGEQVTIRRDPERPLAGGFSLDMRALSDSALTVAAVAVFADAPITIHGIEHIRHHECDRISVACEMLTRLGVKIEERRDGLVVHPGTPRFGVIDSHDDHRIAMSMSLVALGGAGAEVLDPASVRKTCPDFFSMIATLGASIRPGGAA